MDKKKIDLKEIAAGAGKGVADALDAAKRKAVEAMDQDDDGKFDREDIDILVNRAGERVDRLRRESERKRLCPIFEDELDNPSFSMPKLIRIADKDKKHADSEVCRDSIGHESFYKDLRVVNIYPDKADVFGLSYYPDMESELYYADPSNRDLYIALDEYFSYLKIARISELQRIAQDLGAKHFRVTYKEQKKAFSASDAKGKLGVKASGQGASGEISHNTVSNDYSKVEIAAEMECIGHTPVEPVLEYFKKDPQIRNLVSLRMADNALTHQSYTLALSNSSGIKVKDAIKIDMALETMKIAGNATVTSEAQSESRRYFEYEIDF